MIGILGRQGNLAEHAAVLEHLGEGWRLVLAPNDLDGCRALVLPGGESTTQRLLWKRTGLWDALGSWERPVLGSCAGAIHLAVETTDGEETLGLLDVTVRRNGWGTQIDSFKGRVDLPEAPMEALFIRAPRFTRLGDGVEVLASCRDEPAIVRQGDSFASACHPEALGETALHSMFLESLGA